MNLIESYVEALKVNPDLLAYFTFFSDLHEHVKNKTTNSLLTNRNINIEFIFIKAIKGFKQIAERLDKVLKQLDPNYQSLSQEKEIRRLKSFRGRPNEFNQEELKASSSIALCSDKYLTPDTRKYNFDFPIRDELATVRNNSRNRFLLESKSDYEEEIKQSEVKEEEIRIKIEEIFIKENELTEEEKNLNERESKDSKDESLGAASYLLKHNPLARAMMTPYKVPGWKMRGMLPRQPLPVKEIPDEDFIDELEDEVHLESKKTTEGIPKIKEPLKKKLISNEALNTIADLLYEALSIAKEQSESLSKTINEAEIEYLIY